MATENGKFEKPLSMGVSVESGYFTEDGSAGFSLSSFAGRLNLKFWKKGEKSSENRDNTISLNVNQAWMLGQVLSAIVTQRGLATTSANYLDVTNCTITLDGNVNGSMMVFGVIRFDTVSIDGIKRIKMTVLRNKTENSIVFSDRFFKSSIQNSPGFDPLDASLFRFFGEVKNYIDFSSWQMGAFNKIFNTIVKPSSGNGGGNNRGNYSSGSGSSSRGGSTSRKYEDDQSTVFDNDGSEF